MNQVTFRRVVSEKTFFGNRSVMQVVNDFCQATARVVAGTYSQDDRFGPLRCGWMLKVKQLAVPIPLKVWQDPQGDVVLQHSRAGCTISFACWDDAGEPADYLCQLVFDHAWAVRAVNSEFLPFEIDEPQRSCIYEIKNSEWLTALSKERGRYYPEWKNGDKRSYHHYVVQGHDNYCEVLAEGFVERIVPRDEAGVLASLIDES